MQKSLHINTTDGEPPKNSLAFNRKCYTLALPQPMYKNPLFTIVWTKRDPLFDKNVRKADLIPNTERSKSLRHHSLFRDLKPILQQQPVLREGPSKLPVADASQFKLLE